MIPGSFYKGSDLPITLDTGQILTGATVSINAKFQDGSVHSYSGTVLNFTQVLATIPAADNIQPGQINLQANVVWPDTTVAIGETEIIVILNSFAP